MERGGGSLFPLPAHLGPLTHDCSEPGLLLGGEAFRADGHEPFELLLQLHQARLVLQLLPPRILLFPLPQSSGSEEAERGGVDPFGRKGRHWRGHRRHTSRGTT